MEWLVGGFDYNRENFFFDKEQKLKRVFQGQRADIKRFCQYRDDIRDLIDLTVSKMDNYLIVNALFVDMCVALLTEGRPEGEGGSTAPQWLHFLYGMTCVSALFYSTMSMWLAMHASLAAHAFGVQLLTQLVRLPVPGKRELDSAVTDAREFENLAVLDMFRIPVVKQQLTRIHDAVSSENQGRTEMHAREGVGGVANQVAPRDGQVGNLAAETPLRELEHVQRFRELQACWQGFDAYARVSMAVGANQLLHAASYYALRMLISEERSPWPALAVLGIFGFCAWLLARLDLYISVRELKLAATLLLAPPSLTMVGITIDVSTTASWVVRAVSDVCAPLTFLLHMAWLVFVLNAAKASDFTGVSLPTNFRSVLYLDVFGWLTPSTSAADGAAGAGGLAGARGASGCSPDAGGEAADDVSSEDEFSQVAAFMERQTSFQEREALAEEQRRQRAQLVSACREARAQLERDLRRLESPGVEQNLRGSFDTWLLPVIQDFRERFDRVDAQLAQVLADTEGVWPEVEALDDPETYLRLPWSTSWQTTYYYYCVELDKSVWTMPGEPCRLLSLQEEELGHLCVRAQVEGFGLMVQRLVTEFPLEEQLPQIGSQSPGFQQASAATTSPDGAEGARDAGGACGGLGDFGDAGGAQPAPAAAAAAAALPEAGRRQLRMLRRPKFKPGSVPWRIFCRGSAFMVAVWAMGFVWCSLRLIDDRIDHSWLPVGAEKGELQLLSVGPAPHPFFKAVGLGCAAVGGGGSSGGGRPKLLVAEEFGVHELFIPPPAPAASGEGTAARPTLSWVPALERCLGNDPASHASGFSGVAMLCAGDDAGGAVGVGPSGPCGALLLAAGGREALLCGPDGGNASRVALRGGPWRSIAAVTSSGEVGPHLVATRAADGGSVLLRPAAAAGSRVAEFVPELEVGFAHGDSAAPRHIVASGRRLLALRNSERVGRGAAAESELVDWRPAAAVARLPSVRQLPAGWLWQAMCADALGAYLLASASPASAAPPGAFGAGSAVRPKGASAGTVSLWRWRPSEGDG